MTGEPNQQIGKALGRLASGVYIITRSADGQPAGMLATWVGQVAFEPPMISVSFKKERAILQNLGIGGAFTVNVLAKTNNDIFKSFAKPHSEGLDRFAGLAVTPSSNNCIAFADAVAYLECALQEIVDAGDHRVALATVTGGDILNAESEPMVHLRKSGFQY